MRRRKIPKIITPPRLVNGSGSNRVERRSVRTRKVKPTSSRERPSISNTNFELVTSFPPQEIKSNRLFIIAGGPSVKNVNLNLLKDEDVMCVNAAIKLIPNPKYFVTLDYSFLTKGVTTIDEINQKITGKSFFILKTNNPNLIVKNGIVEDKRHNFPYTDLKKFSHVIATDTDLNPHEGFSRSRRNFVNGNNSGFSAIQLGILLGYEEIYLIGFDLGFDDNRQTHFHSWYGPNTNIKSKITGYKNDMLEAAKRFNTIGHWTNKPVISTLTDSPLNTYFRKNKLTAIIKEPKKTKEFKPKPYVIVSYYTINTPYEQEALKLKASLTKLNVPYDIVGVKNLGNWQANTRFKAKFMQDMLIKHKGKSVVWVDSDAVIHSYPKLFDTYDCDVAVRWQDFSWRKNECLSGTIYLANNPMTLELCRRWEGENVAEGPGAKTFEQWNLGKAIEDMRREGKIKDENLPPEYTMIFDSMRKMYPNITPVIEHFQASRKLRNKV